MIEGSKGAGTLEPFRDSSSNRNRSIEDGERWSSVRVRSRTLRSDTLRSRFGGWYRMNLMGFASSRSDDLTKAYTERILSVEGKVFSSCVRSVNLMRMVVFGHLSRLALSAASR